MPTETVESKVVFEVRICPDSICPVSSNGQKYNTVTMFRDADKSRAIGWFRWRVKKDPATKSITKQWCQSVDKITFADPAYPWGDRNANIYRDWCVYSGDAEKGFERKKPRIVDVKGFMLDFDSHTNDDMPLADIARIIESPEFQAAVPCNRIVMSGRGYQLHFFNPKDFNGSEAEKAAAIAEYEGIIAAAMGYFVERWKLRPDPACKDINRLHRLCPSFNTKRLQAVDDDANRIPVRMVLDRKADPKALAEFLRELSGRAVAMRRHAKPGVGTELPLLPVAEALKLALEPPCMKALWEKGAGEGHRNSCRYALTMRLRNSGIAENDAVKLVGAFNGQCSPPENEGAVSDQVRQCYAKPPTDPGCTYIHGTCKACAFQSKPLEDAKAGCPFIQKKLDQPQHPYVIGKRGNILRRERTKLDDKWDERLVPVTQEGRVVVTTVIEDRGSKLYQGDIVNGDWRKTFELPASAWASRGEFSKHVKGLAGEKLMFLSRDAEHLSLASEYLCQDKKIRVLRDFGWNEGFTEFFGGVCVISRDGIRPPSTEVLRANHRFTSKLRLGIPESDLVITPLLQHMKTDLMHFNNPEVIRRVIAVSFIAPFGSVLRELAHMTNAAPSLIIQGTTGTGKTSMLLLGARLFGMFRESDIMSFASTPRAVNDLGYTFKDALYVVDDLKWASLAPSNQAQIIQILQAYADGHGRNRLLSTVGGEWEPSTGKEIRGTICISAEDLPTGEASIFGRFMITALEHSSLDRDRLSRCLRTSAKYNLVMTAFLHWYLSTMSHDDLIADVDTHRRTFERGVPSSAVNTIRVCTQLALNLVGYRLFLNFGQAKGVFEAGEATDLAAMHETGLVTLRDQRLAQIGNETPVEKFLTMVASLLSSGKVKLYDGNPDFGKSVIGFHEDDPQTGESILYLNASVAYGAVQRAFQEMNERIPFSQQSLGQQLKSMGYLAKFDRGRLTYSKSFGGHVARCYAIKSEKLDFETGDPASDAQEVPTFPDGPGQAVSI